MNQFLNYFIQFFIGGSVIVGMSYLTKQFNTKYAALLYAIPVQFTIAAVLIYKESGKQVIQNLCISTFYSMIILGGFLITLYLLLKKFSFGASITYAYAMFIFIVFGYIKLLK